jgi:alanyl-tRNA synthetase
MQTGKEIREKFINFFKERDHKIVPSSSLIPEDQTVLLTSAGMQQFIPYLTGERSVEERFGSRHLVSIQKCFRTPDIDEVGDDVHHTFFEMLGNWSIGEYKDKGYFKEGSIKLALDFLINEIGLKKENFWITIFKGEKNIERDTEALNLWKKYGIPEERIFEFGIEDNFWGPIGGSGPCGPCSEIHYDRGEKYGCGNKSCGPNCPNCNRFVELWNLVFMQYNKKEDGSFEKLKHTNIDTGMGFERLISILQNKDSSYETDLFEPVIKKIEELSKKEYKKDSNFRIIADHVRGSVFLSSEGIIPSNIGRGYLLRRLIRRTVNCAKALGLSENFLLEISKEIIKIYSPYYPELKSKESEILTVIQKEQEKFEKTLETGLKEFQKLIESNKEEKVIEGKKAFDLYQNYGFPLELTEEMAKKEGFKVDKEGFKKSKEKHQEASRAGKEKKFGGVGKQSTEKTTKYHTLTHLLHASLRKVLGEHVKQMGSDITEERLRFDFSHPQKMTEQELKEVEEMVNEKIKEDLKVKREEKTLKEALESGALSFFKEKYPEKVSIYTIFNEKTNEVFSKEICAGPHIERTSELGQFKIKKEESSGSGVRRIKAILE